MSNLSDPITQELKERWPEKKRYHLVGRIPYGYVQKEGDPLSLVPDWDVILCLEQALDLIDNGASIRTAADWLAEASGKRLSHTFLNKYWTKLRARPDHPRLAKLEALKEASKPKNRKQRRVKDINHKLGLARRKMTNAKKQEEKLLAKLPEEKVEEYTKQHVEYVDMPPELLEEDVIFKPNEGPQTTFLAAPEQEVLYGGAAGGGKSYALLADPMRYFAHPSFNGLILRRTNDELRELIWKSQELYPRAYPGARWSEKKSSWTFPAGGHLWFTYLERDEDVQRYQGQAFCYIAFDELTQYPTPFAWNYLRSRLRTASKDLPLYMRATSNPGGPGHGWVKRMFIDPAVPGKAFIARDIDKNEPLVYPPGHAKEGQPLFFRRFIPANVKDNPYLWEDGQYEANLLSLPEDKRRQLLEGDWNIADGAAFGEWREKHHVIDPFPIPSSWKRFRSCDFGYSSHSAVHWFAIDPATETLIVYRELYVSKLTAHELSKKILEMEEHEEISYGVLDSSCWHVRGILGPTIEEEMRKAGTRWRPSDRTQGARTAGKNRLHELLRVDPFTQQPGIQFFNTCRQIISDLPVIPAHPDGKEDIDDRYASDHAYDSIRYGVMTRPSSKSPWADFDQIPTTHRRPIIGNMPSDSVFGY